MFIYFSFNNWHVGYFDAVAIEQFTKFMTWKKVLSYKIERIITDFHFDINNKWRLEQNNISFSFSFVVVGIFVWSVILQSLLIAGFFLSFLAYFFFDSLNMFSLHEKVEIVFSINVGICLTMLCGWFESLWIYNI